MNALRERNELQLMEAEMAQKHNEKINENFLKLKLEKFYEGQFEEETQETPVATEAVVEETPLYISPTNTARLEQLPTVTEYPSPTAAAVFTAQKFETVNANLETPVAPVEMATPVRAMESVTAVSYALTPLAKVIMAAFTLVVVAMLAIICMNTQIIRQKSIRIQNLEEKKQQLLEQSQEIQRRIEAAQSEETIRQYAIENGMISAGN